MEKVEIENENSKLRASWNCLPAEHLDNYLMQGEQDQRINIHSILNRALLVDSLWPGKFDGLITEEFRFGLVMTWILQQLQEDVTRKQLLDSIMTGAGEDGSADVPDLVATTALYLQSDDCPLPDYIAESLLFVDRNNPDALLPETALNIFQNIWSNTLQDLESPGMDVLEIACGSGNDFQAIRNANIEPYISYSGLDISSKNISNARHKFPGVDFFEASILDSAIPDDSYDVVFAHDVIGHLSGEGMDRALGEIMRISRSEIWIHCFNAVDIDQHEIIPYFQYHRNRISISQFAKTLEDGGFSVEVIKLPDMLKQKFDYVQDYVSTSVSFVANSLTR